jgi:hypothetical protein
MKKKLLKTSLLLAFLVTISGSFTLQAKTLAEKGKSNASISQALCKKYTITEDKSRAVVFPVISLVSDYSNPSTQLNGWVINSGNFDFPMTTTDGITYTLASVFLAGVSTATGNTSPYWVKFRQDNGWTNNWGSSAFPSGTGVQNGDNIDVTTPGTYSVSFNFQTGAYVFTLVTPAPVISIIGASLGTAWTTDIDLTVTDGFNYSLLAYNLPAGELKFRQGHAWGTNWGGSAFPAGTGVSGGANIAATPGGLYDISFNRFSFSYSFTPTLSVTQQNQLKLEVYPNPSTALVTIQITNNLSLDKIIISDLTGKIVMEQTQNSNQVNVEKLSAGMYILQAFSGTEKFQAKFIKE